MQSARKVPWKKMAEDRDCGAAAFASIASHHGHHITVEESREIVQTDRSGTSMRWICEGSRSIGLGARGVRADYNGLTHLPLPTIVHLDEADGHYMVLTSISSRAVECGTPAELAQADGPFRRLFGAQIDAGVNRSAGELMEVSQ